MRICLLPMEVTGRPLISRWGSWEAWAAAQALLESQALCGPMPSTSAFAATMTLSSLGIPLLERLEFRADLGKNAAGGRLHSQAGAQDTPDELAA